MWTGYTCFWKYSIPFGIFSVPASVYNTTPQRSMFTASDAIYCAKFVELCHKMQSENFSTLIYFDRIFSDVSLIVTNCTDNEASRFVWVFV